QKVAAIRRDEEGRAESVLMRWGFVPSWDLGNEKPKFQPGNARSETVREKRMFSSAVEKRRCLVIADGFYEWGKTTKIPHHVQLKGGRPFVFAAIYQPASEVWPESMAILTTA